MERACELGSDDACGFLGMLLVDGFAGVQDTRRGATLLTAGCGKGSGPSCTRLGRLYQEGKATPGEGVTPRLLFVKACEELSHGEGCLSLGTDLVGEAMGDENEERGYERFKVGRGYFEKSCNFGTGEGCSEAGTAWVSEDKNKASTLWKKGCEIGDQVCCQLLQQNGL